jgi:hypothetical protein
MLDRNAWEPMRAGKLVTPAIVVPLVGDTNLVVTFEYRPGIAQLDLVADLGAFLVAIGELTDPAASKASRLSGNRLGRALTFNVVRGGPPQTGSGRSPRLPRGARRRAPRA